LNDTAHYEPHAPAIVLPDLSSSDQSIKFVSFHSGDSFVFLDLPLAGIVDQSAAYPGSVWRIAASHCGLELIQAGRKAHVTTGPLSYQQPRLGAPCETSISVYRWKMACLLNMPGSR